MKCCFCSKTALFVSSRDVVDEYHVFCLAFWRSFTIFSAVNFYKTTIHFQNSSKSVTLHMPAILFKAWPVLRFFVAIGVLLFMVQVVSTTIYDGVLNHQLNERAKLDREMTQIQGTLDYLSNTTNSFFNDENRLYARFSLPMQDEASRELGTGGSISADSLLLRKTSPVFERMSILGETAQRIQGKLANNDASFRNLNKYMDQKMSAWRFVP